MSILKYSSELQKLINARSGWSSRAFVSAAPRPLQGKKSDEETNKNVRDMANAVKDGAKEVTKTCEYVRDTVSSAADSVTDMTKGVTGKVTEVIKDKAKDTVTSGVWGAAKNTTEIIKDKITGK